jgi:hypothetical protein
MYVIITYYYIINYMVYLCLSGLSSDLLLSLKAVIMTRSSVGLWSVGTVTVPVLLAARTYSYIGWFSLGLSFRL